MNGTGSAAIFLGAGLYYYYESSLRRTLPLKVLASAKESRNCEVQDAKGAQFTDEILRPDDPAYHFSHYFIYDFHEHKLCPNPSASIVSQMRAEVTINIFQLNHPGLSKTRKRNLSCYRSGEYQENELGFRFMFQFI